MSVASKLEYLNNKLGSVKLVAVTKYTTLEKVKEAYEFGHRDFGENYVQNLVERANSLPKDIRWHMIGKLQTNKIKYLAKMDNLYMIHSIEKIKQVEEIEKRFDKKINCLVEVNLSGEESKSGILPEDIDNFFKLLYNMKLNNVIIKGLMTISALNASDTEKEEVFKSLNKLKYSLKKYENENITLEELSMGMSDDYELALKHGATIVRIGSFIFS